MPTSLKEYLRGSNGSYTRLWIGLALALIVVLLLFVNYLMHDTSGERMARDLEREFELVQPLPEAFLIEHYTKVDGGIASVENTYESSVSNEAIQKHYDLELPKQGWKQCGGGTMRDENHRNVNTVSYCKRSYIMLLVYPEDDTVLRRQFWLRLKLS